MVNLSFEEIENIFLSRNLNSKNNNYIISGLSLKERDLLIRKSYNSKMQIENYEQLKGEYYIPQSNYLNNIVINLQQISIKDILSLSLKLLNINENNLTFDDWKKILKFKQILKEYGKGVEFIFYNPSVITDKEQELINNLFYLSEYLFSEVNP